MDSTHTFIQIHPKDNTAVALTSLKKDSVLNLDGRMYTLLEDIPQGHKFALEKISAGSAVIKYGSPIGSSPNGRKSFSYSGRFLDPHS